MKHLKFSKLERKKAQNGVRVSKSEKKQLDDFCLENGILKSDLVRRSIRLVLNQEI